MQRAAQRAAETRRLGPRHLGRDRDDRDPGTATRRDHAVDLPATTSRISPHYHWRSGTIAGVPVMVARTGYTGEDGFEFYGPIDEAGAIWDALMAAGKAHGLQPIGLGARDTLRLEARMPLYGHELDDDITRSRPVSAGRSSSTRATSSAARRMAAVKAEGAARKAVGFQHDRARGAPRTHYPVGVDGQEVGEVTSGAFRRRSARISGWRWLRRSTPASASHSQVEIRGKSVHAEQVKMPFYKRRPDSNRFERRTRHRWRHPGI